MGDDNNAVTFRDAKFLDDRILEVKQDLLAELSDLKDEMKLMSGRMYDMNREVGGLKVRVSMISGIVGAVSGVIAALGTKLGLH